MELEQQVVSLEVAKKLKELGVKQESYFSWDLRDNTLWRTDSFGKFELQVCTFTVAELGEILPDAIASWKYTDADDDEDDIDIWTCIKYLKHEHSKYEHLVNAPTEADCRAKMLIYLLENKLIKL